MMESDKAEGVVEMAQVISTGAGGAGLVAIAQLLGSQTEIHVRQKVNGLEAVSGGRDSELSVPLLVDRSAPQLWHTRAMPAGHAFSQEGH